MNSVDSTKAKQKLLDDTKAALFAAMGECNAAEDFYLAKRKIQDKAIEAYCEARL